MIEAIDLAKAGRCVVCGVRVLAGEGEEGLTCDGVCSRAKAGGLRRDEQIEEDGRAEREKKKRR